ncbi:glutamine amidotransferase [Corynebacterium sp. 3HC-13]|uniref:glutamine amidotransferase n=1 Tax=Corynebacterium poyangense TaxID=2684405 RepID=UPI001CD012CB|nr:glutamine amidotransferase [Corynebacterium poyangense]MBZ8177811.1 glutamine amidotransferase [Corynebacterium poyangense]
MVSLLLISSRQDPAACASEFHDVVRTAGISSGELSHQIVDSTLATLRDLNSYDGIIVGGSALNVTDTTHYPYQQHVHRELEQLLTLDIPTLFICFGNTYLADLTGGSVTRDYGEPAGKTWVELTESGKKDLLTAHLPQQFSAYTGHKEAVKEVGRGVDILATGPQCPVQMVRANDSTWACQFHPDLDHEGMCARMGFNLTGGYFSPEDFDTITAELASVSTSAANSIMKRFVEIAQEWTPGTSTIPRSSRIGAR